jgi:hypothetical protein
VHQDSTDLARRRVGPPTAGEVRRRWGRETARMLQGRGAWRGLTNREPNVTNVTDAIFWAYGFSPDFWRNSQFWWLEDLRVLRDFHRA